MRFGRVCWQILRPGLNNSHSVYLRWYGRSGKPSYFEPATEENGDCYDCKYVLPVLHNKEGLTIVRESIANPSRKRVITSLRYKYSAFFLGCSIILWFLLPRKRRERSLWDSMYGPSTRASRYGRRTESFSFSKISS